MQAGAGRDLKDGNATGSYTGAYDTETRKGGVSGEALPRTGPAGRYRLKLFQALRAAAPNALVERQEQRYAIDMWLTFRIDENGKAIDAQLESPVPDYRRYSARVASIDVRFDGSAFTGTVVADIDHGGQGKNARGGCTRHERYTYEMAGHRHRRRRHRPVRGEGQEHP